MLKNLKGCGMGPWLVFVSPCFRENVLATCKIGSFLCSLDNLLQKNVIVIFLEIIFQNGAHLKKELFLTYFSHFLVTRESYKNFFSTYLTHIHTHILLTLLTFFTSPILKKIQIYQIWFFSGRNDQPMIVLSGDWLTDSPKIIKLLPCWSFYVSYTDYPNIKSCQLGVKRGAFFATLIGSR